MCSSDLSFKFYIKIIMNSMHLLQDVKKQLKNAEMQIDNLELTMKNINQTNIGMQINDIGIQLLNMGIQMINIGKLLPINPNDILIFNQNIQNVLNQLQNIAMPNQQMGIRMGMMNMPPILMNNFMVNNDFMKGFYNGIMEGDKKQNIEFNLMGKTKIISANSYTTVGNLLREYLKGSDKSEKEVYFVYKGNKISFGDNTRVRDFFKNDDKPIILGFTFE